MPRVFNRARQNLAHRGGQLCQIANRIEPDIVIDNKGEETEDGENENNDEEDLYLAKAREVLLRQ